MTDDVEHGQGVAPGCLYAVAWLACLALALSWLPGCGASPQAQRYAAIESTALVVGTTGDAVELAAEADARTCTGALDVTACLIPVRERWAPVDVALDGLRLALGAWLVAEQTADGGSTWPTTIARLFALYRELAMLLEPLGVEVPALTLGGI